MPRPQLLVAGITIRLPLQHDASTDEGPLPATARTDARNTPSDCRPRRSKSSTFIETIKLTVWTQIAKQFQAFTADIPGKKRVHLRTPQSHFRESEFRITLSFSSKLLKLLHLSPGHRVARKFPIGGGGYNGRTTQK